MNRDRLSRFWIAAVAGYVLVTVAALAAPVWLRLVLCLLCLGGAAWWGLAVTRLLRQESAMRRDLAAKANAEAERRARLEAAARELIRKINGCAALAAALSECAACQRQTAEGVADSLEEVALIQEDFSQLDAGLSVAIEKDGPVIRGLVAELLALARACQDRTVAAIQVLAGLQATLERGRRGDASRSGRQLTAIEKLLSEVEQGHAALAESAAAMAAWHRPIDEIGQAVQLATDLAEQARILGVNASIEALRSGEAGRGFLLVAEEAERLSDRMLRVAHQMSSQIEESDKTAAVVIKRLDEVKAFLARLGEQGRRVADQIQEDLEYDLPVPRAEVEQLADLVAQLAAAAGGLDGRLAEMLGHLEIGPAEEGQQAAKRLFGTLGDLTKESKNLAAKLDTVCEAARENESQLGAVEEVGRDLEAVLAGGA